MHLEHNSYLAYYRAPFGAVTTNTNITLRLLVGSYNVPDEVKVNIDGVFYPMYFKEEIYHNRIYEYQFAAAKTPGLCWYYFYAASDGEAAFYGAGQGGVGVMCSNAPENKYQITVYAPFETPAWFQKAVVYQIFVDSFWRGGNTPVKGYLHRRDEAPFYDAAQFGGTYLANDTYGGNLYGIVEKLPYLQDLGVTCLYLTPIFEADTNHKYNTGDYENVDPCFGGNEAFSHLVKEAEKRGMKIILDGVFSHTGSNSRYFNKNGAYPDLGAYQSKNSPYYPWYTFSQYPDAYDSWWGFSTLPAVNKNNESFCDYILKNDNAIVKRWLRAGASGWRLDVADELPDRFLAELRRQVKKQNPNAVIIGEVWEDASNKEAYGVRREYFLGGELDSVMNYPLRSAVIDFLTQQTDAYGFYLRVMRLYENYPRPCFYSLLNLLGSHDVARITTVLGGAPPLSDKAAQAAYRLPQPQRRLALSRLAAALCLIMTFPGAPCIYYGDENGQEGYRDPFNRAAFCPESGEGWLREHCKALIALRKRFEALTTGGFAPVCYAGRVFAYLRRGKPNFLVAVNGGGAGEEVCLDAGVLRAARFQNALTGEAYPVINGRVSLSLPPYGAVILQDETLAAPFCVCSEN